LQLGLIRLGVGLVASLSHPGGNVTGLSLQATEAAGKRIGLLREVVPELGRLGILFDAGYAAAVREKGEVQTVARALGLEGVPQEIRRAEDIASAFNALKGHAEALYITENALIFANSKTIATLAFSAQLPTTCTNADIARVGALMSYGPNFPALFRRGNRIGCYFAAVHESAHGPQRSCLAKIAASQNDRQPYSTWGGFLI
jgi:putative tryptophan/tyrosine transport system substrate-binding protein